MRAVGVVIPYFQEEKGLLRRALESVAAQELPADVRLDVMVVDDGSPVPAWEEVDGFNAPPWVELTITAQANAGPAAARNSALDRLSEKNADYVAFLDSDDIWYAEHLATALEQLRHSDFHFANVDEDERDFFSYAEYIGQHHRRDGGGSYHPPTRTVTGNEAFRALLRQCFVHTSQVVYDFGKWPGIRFATDQRHAGEDLLFWLELSRKSDRISYSASPMGARGRGVSLYRGALSWDSPRALDSLIDGLKLQKKISRYDVDPAERSMLRRKRRQMRDRLMFLMLRALPRRPDIVCQAAIRLAKELPDYFLHAPASLLRVPSHVRMTRAKAGADRLDQKVPA